MAEPQYLLDANLCIYLLQGRSEIAARRVSDCSIGQLVTSAIVFAEVMLGAHRLGRADRALAFFAQVPTLPFDRAAGEAYARLSFKRASYDRLIAAHALALNLAVVTSNAKDFADVPGLIVEDWTR